MAAAKSFDSWTAQYPDLGVFNSSPVEQAGPLTTGTAYVRQVSCWTTFVLIQ